MNNNKNNDGIDPSPARDRRADFQEDLETISTLRDTPSMMREVALSALSSAVNTDGLGLAIKQSLERAITTLKNIEDDSIKDSFKTIYSQMCILAVSSLEDSLKGSFIELLNSGEHTNLEDKKFQDIKISLKDIADYGLDLSHKIGEIIVARMALNFQDLKSIKRNFKDYANKELLLEGDTEKKICFYLEARHVLAHRSGIVDDKMAKAVESFSANIKGVKKGDKLELNNDDWENILDAFPKLVQAVV